jgi:SAM-dependent methyltransferase
MGYREHYETLLAEHYSWMSGSWHDKISAEQARLIEFGVHQGGLAVDLGCGPGYQAIALAELGFLRVLALDTSAALLAELRGHVGDRPIEPVEADMVRLSDFVPPAAADCVTCMGDTLTHLASRDAVAGLFGAVRTALKPNGIFVLSWRDLTAARTGADRFLMPRADADRILTCFLEVADEEHVRVHDIVHRRDGTCWTMQVSAYEKLRLAAAWVAGQLQACGLAVAKQQESGGFIVMAVRHR